MKRKFIGATNREIWVQIATIGYFHDDGDNEEIGEKFLASPVLLVIVVYNLYSSMGWRSRLLWLGRNLSQLAVFLLVLLHKGRNNPSNSRISECRDHGNYNSDSMGTWVLFFQIELLTHLPSEWEWLSTVCKTLRPDYRQIQTYTCVYQSLLKFPINQDVVIIWHAYEYIKHHIFRSELS